MQEHNQFQNHAKNYYDLYMNMIIAVLANEIIYKKNTEEIIYKIMNDTNVNEAKINLKDLSIKKRFFYSLIWKHKPRLAYNLSKLYFKLKQKWNLSLRLKCLKDKGKCSK